MDANGDIGMFNYGRHLLRDRGVPRDAARGQTLIQMAASLDLQSAERLVENNFNLDVATLILLIDQSDHWLP